VSVGKSFLVLALLVASSTTPSPAAGPDRPAEFHGTGVVVALLPPPSSLHATRPVIVIHHDPLLPLMPESMDMPFLAASTTLLGHVKTGDHVVFTLRDTPDALLVVDIERAPR